MASNEMRFGALLCEELKKLNRFDLITSRCDYAAIQKLKAADREATVKLFQGSAYEVLQALKKLTPAEAARYLVDLHKTVANSAAYIGIMTAAIQ
jgi:hypothetical protein